MFFFLYIYFTYKYLLQFDLTCYGECPWGLIISETDHRFCIEIPCEKRTPLNKSCFLKSDIEGSLCYYYNDTCVSTCAFLNTVDDFSDKNNPKCIDEICKNRVSVDGSCALPSDNPQMNCSFIDGKCQLICPEDVIEGGSNNETSECISSVNVPNSKNVGVIVGCIFLIIIASLLSVVIGTQFFFIIYYYKKKKSISSDKEKEDIDEELELYNDDGNLKEEVEEFGINKTIFFV